MFDKFEDFGFGVVCGVGLFFKKLVFGVSDLFFKVIGSFVKGFVVVMMDKQFQDR